MHDSVSAIHPHIIPYLIANRLSVGMMSDDVTMPNVVSQKITQFSIMMIFRTSQNFYPLIFETFLLNSFSSFIKCDQNVRKIVSVSIDIDQKLLQLTGAILVKTIHVKINVN